MADLVARACAAYAWQRALGHEVVEHPLCRIVRDPAHPDVWDANHVSGVRAADAPEVDTVLRQADAALARCAHRLFVVDPLTPPAFAARLALDDYRELTPTIQMVLDGPLRAAPPAVALRPVTRAADWQSLAALLAADHAEGARTGGPIPAHVTDGMLASYRAKAPAYQFYLARVGGEDCAYGAGVRCAGDLGMVEDLFTLPRLRRRGIAGAIIARAVADLRRGGSGPVLIGAHAGEPPKRLYAALGFAPVCVTREYIVHVASGQGFTRRTE
ncbi:MAG TPA: GNAT family N-acetyltransferase [Candidatus Dormibacteraeota bacterium]|nr:GNAT family N-acetyltransferase [Candidatus Dormibacteraeota bacterium]